MVELMEEVLNTPKGYSGASGVLLHAEHAIVPFVQHALSCHGEIHHTQLVKPLKM